MQLWQLDTIAVDDKFKALYDLCEEQESTIEDLRYELGEANERADDAELETDQRDDELRKIEKERDDLKAKLDAIQKMLEEVDDMGCSLEYINEILNLLE